MTLIQFEKISSEVRTEYIVFDENNKYVETIKVNYIDDDLEVTRKNLLRRFKYDKWVVRNVSVNTATHYLSVTIEPPKKRK